MTNITDYAVALFTGRLQSTTGIKHTVDLVCDIGMMTDIVPTTKKMELMRKAFTVTEKYLDTHF